MIARFRDRTDGGRRLAAELRKYAHDPDLHVLALPRGGVPVACEVAHALGAPLDAFVVRTLGLPGHDEYAMGAIASGGIVVVKEDVTRRFSVSDADLARIVEKERRALKRREERYRGSRPLPEVRGRTVILIDDGLTTGSVMRAAIAALRQVNPSRLVVAMPISSLGTCDVIRAGVDEIVSAERPEMFYAADRWYADLPPITDDEVRDLLDRAEPSCHDPVQTPHSLRHASSNR